MKANIVFWQNMPAFHQSGSLRYLSQKWNGDIFCVFDTKLFKERKSLGWEVPDLGCIQSYFLNEINSPKTFVENFIKTHADSIHIICGVRGCQSINLAWDYLGYLSNPKIGCILERPHYNSLQGFLKKIWYWNFFKKKGKNLKAVLAMGKIGIETYQNLGVSSKILFPYMYQVDCKTYPKPSKMLAQNEPIRFVYIGRFAPEKGVNILSKALTKLPSKGWTMDWIGRGGKFEKKIINQSKQIDGIYFKGYFPSDQILTRLSKYDVAIIPSSYDGWGMVVNEALFAGIGVIVTDQVGAKDLVETSQAGVEIKAGNVQCLADAMNNLIADHSIANKWKANARQHYPLLNSERLGQYLHDVLQYAFLDLYLRRPEPYWLDSFFQSYTDL